MKPSRTLLIDTFLKKSGWGGVRRIPLATDASFRRYERLKRNGESIILMDAPPPKEDTRAYIVIARHLRQLGLSAPEIIEADEKDGLLLIEDLGDDTYARLLADGGDERMLYTLAVDVLIDLHKRPKETAVAPGSPRYDNTRFLQEALLFTDWYLPAVTGKKTPDDTRQTYSEAWLDVLGPVHAQPQTLVLRDYHMDNLLYLPGREGVRACGILDFQDAVSGPIAYDLMSLLEDARRGIDEDLAKNLLERYFRAFPELDRDDFRTAYAILGAQRHAKVIGIFIRLDQRDGKPAYLEHLPRVWTLLEKSLGHPALAPVADWFEIHVPPSLR